MPEACVDPHHQESSPVTAHLKTALVESQDLVKAEHWQPPAEGGYSNRASSLTPTSVTFLESIGAWRHVDQQRTQPFDQMQVWDASNDASIRFDWKSEAVTYNAPLRTVATMTENANLIRGLLARISELDGGHGSLFSNTRLSSIEHGEDDPEGLNLSSWPVVSLTTATTTPGSGRNEQTPPSETRRIVARLLVGADGVHSPVRTFAGISSSGWDYDRHGVVATLVTESTDTASSAGVEFSSVLSPKVIAYQRFLPALGGPIAMLPLPDNRASLVWSTTPENAAYLKSLPADALTAVLNAGFRLGQTDLKYLFSLPPASTTSSSTSSSSSSSSKHADELSWRLRHTPVSPSTPLPPLITSVQPGTLASFPLRFRQSSSFVSPGARVALIGDAAHTIHPHAGQGLNMGLADAHRLADTIAYAVAHGQDLGGDPFALEPYQAARWPGSLAFGAAIDAVNWVYQSGARPHGEDSFVGEAAAEMASQLRGLGMKIFDSGWLPGLKEWVMRRAES